MFKLNYTIIIKGNITIEKTYKMKLLYEEQRIVLIYSKFCHIKRNVSEPLPLAMTDFFV